MMNRNLKIALYIVFTIGALFCAKLFTSHFKKVRSGGNETSASALKTPAAIGASAQSNFPANAAPNSQTNSNAVALASATNASGTTNVAAEQTPVDSGAASDPGVMTAFGGNAAAKPSHTGRLAAYAGGFFLMVVGLGLLIAHDVSQFMGNRAMRVLFNDEGEGLKNPEYEQAEQKWADGNHLEAIELMREYLNKNPREQHVALRIAEIYEKDLNNFLAAALEYEQVLQHKLPAERWGWAAIHLCNLYFRLGQDDKAVALLHRIDKEYGQTAAAEKARKRLEQIEPGSVQTAALETEEAPPETISKQPVSKLPPGFSSKKS